MADEYKAATTTTLHTREQWLWGARTGTMPSRVVVVVVAVGVVIRSW